LFFRRKFYFLQKVSNHIKNIAFLLLLKTACALFHGWNNVAAIVPLCLLKLLPLSTLDLDNRPTSM
jgi:hypothetical protein